MNDNAPPPGRKPSGVVPIVGVVTDDGRVILKRPIRRPAPRPALQLVKS